MLSRGLSQPWPEALEALTHHAVWTSLWKTDARTPVPHIDLAAWAERNATGATPLPDACVAAGISSDLERTLAVARWAYTQADRSETPVWTTASDLERRLSGRWRAILGCGIVAA
jgi:phosphopantothenoylcysteine synthetase/decarboxylase